MSNISQWSNSAAGNTSASPNGFPEGMPPSGVNDAARELMAAVRRQEEAAEWFDWGYTPTYATTTTFTLAGDRTTLFHVGRRVKCGDGSVLYGTISDSTYSANTRVSINLDSGGLTTSLSSVSAGILSLINDSLPRGRFAELSATNTFAAPVNFSATASFLAPVSFGTNAAFSATASFTSKVVFGKDVSVSATASFTSAVVFGGPASFSATATFASKVIFSSGVLGAWASATAGSAVQAATDLWLQAGGDGALGQDVNILIKTDASNPPTTTRARDQKGGIAGRTQVVSVACPVRKGDYYLIENTSVAANAFSYYIPVG